MTPAEAKASLLAQLVEHGGTVTLRRYTGTGPARTSVDKTVRARVIGYSADQLVGNIVQGDQRVIVYADDVSAPLSLPLTVNDKVVIDGKEAAIKHPDHNTRKIAGVQIGIDLQVRGP